MSWNTWPMSNTRELLEQCQLRLLALDSQVDRIRKNSSCSAYDVIPVAPPPSPAIIAMGGERALPRCHECHGPLAEYHKGYPHGVNTCELEHYDLCTGEIKEGNDKGGHFWRGCPPDFTPHPDCDNIEGGPLLNRRVSEENTSAAATESVSGSDTSFDPGPGFVAPEVNDRQTRSKQGAAGIDTGVILDHAKKVDNPAVIDPFKTDLSQDKEDLLLQAEIAEIARLEREAKLLAVKMKKQQAQDDLERLQRQARGEGSKPKIDLGTMHAAVDNIRTQNFVKPSKGGESVYTGPTMDQIRRDSHTLDKVDDLMLDVNGLPVFSHVRPAGAQQSQFGKPRLKQTTHTAQVQHSPSPQYKPADQLFKWVTGVDRYGEEYRTLVEVTPPPKPPPLPKKRIAVPDQPGWTYDEQTGRMYRSSHQSRYQHSTGGRDHRGHSVTTDPVYFSDSRRSVSTPVRHGRGDRYSPVRSYDRRDLGDYRRNEEINRNATEEREGKAASIVTHARNLPIESAKSTTSKNMSFAQFMYGATSELHSSLIGLTPPLVKNELEAKLQHMMNVIHVTCLNAGQLDFKPVSWSVGRTYHNLVQAKVDSGRESWSEFDSLYRGSPHAAEMVAAEREHRVALAKLPKVDKGGKTDRVGVKTERTGKPLCSTWNDFEVEGKCKWESENSGLTCNRSHHCSYCEKKGNSKTYHQERFCKRKLAEDK